MWSKNVVKIRGQKRGQNMCGQKKRSKNVVKKHGQKTWSNNVVKIRGQKMWSKNMVKKNLQFINVVL